MGEMVKSRRPQVLLFLPAVPMVATAIVAPIAAVIASVAIASVAAVIASIAAKAIGNCIAAVCITSMLAGVRRRRVVRRTVFVMRGRAVVILTEMQREHKEEGTTPVPAGAILYRAWIMKLLKVGMLQRKQGNAKQDLTG